MSGSIDRLLPRKDCMEVPSPTPAGIVSEEAKEEAGIFIPHA